MSFLVYHKNPNHPDILSGKEWAIDGQDREWTKEQALSHVIACDYEALGIEYELKLKRKPRKKTRKQNNEDDRKKY